MPQIPTQIQVPDPIDPYTNKLSIALQSFSRKLSDLINKGLRIEDNIDIAEFEFTTAAVGQENTIAHGLGRVPRGYIVTKRDQVVNVYDGTTAWDTSYIYIKSDVEGATVSVLIF